MGQKRAFARITCGHLSWVAKLWLIYAPGIKADLWRSPVTVTYVPPPDHPVHDTHIAHEQLLLSAAFKAVPVVRRATQNVHTLLNL